MASPSPVPPDARSRALSARYRRSKMRGRCSGAMPTPVSATSTTALPPSCMAPTRTLPPGGVARIALVTRLEAIVCTCAAFVTATTGSCPARGPRSSTPRSPAARSSRSTTSRQHSTRSVGSRATSWSRSARVSAWRSATRSHSRPDSPLMISAASRRSSSVRAAPSTSAEANPSIAVMGVRSSCATSARNSRCRRSVAASCAVMAFSDAATRASSPSSRSTRASRSPDATRSACPASAWASRRRRRLARPASHHATAPITRTAPPVTTGTAHSPHTPASAWRSIVTSMSPSVTTARASSTCTGSLQYTTWPPWRTTTRVPGRYRRASAIPA